MIRLGFAVLALTLAVDQTSKSWALTGLGPPFGDSVALLPILNLRLGFNTGISFGLFSESAREAVWLLVAFKTLAVLFLALWLWRSRNPIDSTSLGAIMGGAIGNAADRIRHGAVVDFIDAHLAGWHWPTFNMADVAIVCGVAGLVLSGVKTGGAEQRDHPAR